MPYAVGKQVPYSRPCKNNYVIYSETRMSQPKKIRLTAPSVDTKRTAHEVGNNSDCPTQWARCSSDVLANVFSYLTTFELARMQRVNKACLAVSKGRSWLWAHLDLTDLDKVLGNESIERILDRAGTTLASLRMTIRFGSPSCSFFERLATRLATLSPRTLTLSFTTRGRSLAFLQDLFYLPKKELLLERVQHCICLTTSDVPKAVAKMAVRFPTRLIVNGGTIGTECRHCIQTHPRLMFKCGGDFVHHNRCIDCVVGQKTECDSCHDDKECPWLIDHECPKCNALLCDFCQSPCDACEDVFCEDCIEDHDCF